MTSDEDPEQRIADLERPLLRSAADSELAPGGARTGLRLGWLLLGLMVVGLIVGGGAILIGRTDSPVAGHPVGPTAADKPQGPKPTMSVSTEPAPSIAPPAVPSEPAPQPGLPVSVAGVGNERTIACTDNAVSVSGVNNRVILTGHCTRVEVSGIENIVTVDAADEIGVSGMNNAVTYHSGTPELANSGMGNTLQKD